MAQLTDDCFAYDGPLMPVDVAADLIRGRIKPVAETQTLALRDALGRVLADDLIAPDDLPPYDNSAVDGYAVRHTDLAPEGQTRLPVAGSIFAGRPSPSFPPRSAMRIFTGGAMPPGADTVFMQEDCTPDGDDVVLPAGLKIGANRRKAGEDIARGTLALTMGRRLGPAELALAAALGVASLTVRRRLRVALFSTGDEIVEVGAPRPATGIYDANRTLLASLLRGHGVEVSDLGILRDSMEDVEKGLRAAAAKHDIVLCSGGVSIGEADFVRLAAERAGSLVFWRLAIKPGRPVAMGVLPRGTASEHAAAFVGLPGNPVAAFVTFAKIVRPLLFQLAGETRRDPPPLPVRAAFAWRKKTGRREYVRVRIQSKEGLAEAHKHPQDGAGVITSLTETDGLVELAEHVTAVQPGDLVGFIPYAALIS